MILFQPVIQVAIPAVDDFPAERPADDGGIGSVPVRHHAVQGVADDGTRPAEVGRGRLPILGRAEQRIDQITVPFNGSIQVAPPAVDLNGGFVNMPRAARFAASSGTKFRLS